MNKKIIALSMILSMLIVFGYTLPASASKILFGTPAPGFSNKVRVERLIEAGRFEEAERVRKEYPNYRNDDITENEKLIIELQAKIDELRKQIEELMK